MSRLRADVLLAISLPLLLLGGVLPWQVDRMCTVAGCGWVHTTGWDGSPAWAVPLVLAVAVSGGWLLLLPTRPAPTGVAALAAAVGGLGAMVVITTLDALVFHRGGVFPFRLPVEEEFPVLSVRPGPGLPLGLLGLVGLAAAGWLTVRARNALVTPWRPPRRAATRPAGTPPAATPRAATPPEGTPPATTPPAATPPAATPPEGTPPEGTSPAGTSPAGTPPATTPPAAPAPPDRRGYAGPRPAVGLGQGPPPPAAGATPAQARSGHRRARHR